MAATRFEYVRLFEAATTLLRNTWIVVRLDGRNFHRFTQDHKFAKPNDARCLHLMNKCAAIVMQEYPEIVVAYGQSDEYSFVLCPSATLFGRRESKIVSTLCSLFTAAFVMHWSLFFGDEKMRFPPSFDARAVCYPTVKNMRDYLAWRQADCHINQLYNTAFWALVQDPKEPKTQKEAEALLCTTDSSAKNELLFTRFGINYNNLDPMYRKGSTLFRRDVEVEELAKSGETVVRRRSVVVTEYCDIIGDAFWNENPHLCEG